MTAVALLESLAPYRPTVEDGELVVELDPPAGLLVRLELLHSGVRAILSGRRWQGGTATSGDRPCVVNLDPAKPIPPRVTLLRVEGDSRWDRVPANVRTSTPDLFDHQSKPEPPRSARPQPIWDATVAIALMTAADDLVERLGVYGSDPDIQTAADRVVDAYRARDLPEVRQAAAAFEAEVRRVAGAGSDHQGRTCPLDRIGPPAC
jgi:hypothetical protein